MTTNQQHEKPMKAQARVSPFPVATRNKERHIDVGMLKVEHGTPIPLSARSSKASKYASLFEQLKPGSCIVCESGETNQIAAALRKYLLRYGKKPSVRSLRRCDDGHARVWWDK